MLDRAQRSKVDLACSDPASPERLGSPSFHITHTLTHTPRLLQSGERRGEPALLSGCCANSFSAAADYLGTVDAGGTSGLFGCTSWTDPLGVCVCVCEGGGGGAPDEGVRQQRRRPD